MARLIVFNSVTIDGFFAGPHGDMSWAHAGSDDPEYQAFVQQNASGDSRLLFGRVTYDMMRSYWPTSRAAQDAPAVAARMNGAQKYVVSRTLGDAEWQNTTVLRGELVDGVRRLKGDSGPDIAVLGSGSVVAQLAQARLIDELQLVVCPIIVGVGKPLFAGVTATLDFALRGARSFTNGKVLLTYAPATMSVPV